MEKYKTAEGKIGVIVSYGYGAGWSTWNDYGEFAAMDRTLVEMKLREAGRDEVVEYLGSIGRDFYMGGWDTAKVEWLDEGQAFVINEYDGSECLEVEDRRVMRA